ncbi:MAG: NMD3-related protein [Thermoplasmata archaeon]
MFCVECGKEPDELYDGMCAECYKIDKLHADITDKIDIDVCGTCGAVKKGNRWIEHADIYTIILDRIDSSIETSPDVEKYSFKTDFREQDPLHIEATVQVELFAKGLSRKVDLNTLVLLRKDQCKTCSRIHGNYYEAILQVRPSTDKMTTEQKEQVKKKVSDEIEVKRSDERNIFVTSEEEKHGGLDFYISDNGVTKRLAKKLSNLFGGHVTTSAKLAGREDGKNIYKVTYSVRLPPYETGDFLVKDDKLYRVQEVRTSGGYVVLVDMDTRKKVSVKERDMDEFNLLEGDELVKKAVVVSQTEDEIKILDPDNYQTVTLIKPDDIEASKDEVDIVKVKGKIHIVT